MGDVSFLEGTPPNQSQEENTIDQAFTNLLGMGVAASGYAVGKVHGTDGFLHWLLASQVGQDRTKLDDLHNFAYFRYLSW